VDGGRLPRADPHPPQRHQAAQPRGQQQPARGFGDSGAFQIVLSKIVSCLASNSGQSPSALTPDGVVDTAEGDDHRLRRRYRPHSVASPVISSATLHGSGTWIVSTPICAVCLLCGGGPKLLRWTSVGVTS